MKIKKLKAEDLLKTLEYLSQRYSSADNINTYMESPIHVLAYQEMNRFSKEELEQVKRSDENDSIYYAVRKTRNSLFFSCLIEKEAFAHKLLPESKWLLENTKHTPCVYEAVFNYQRDKETHYQTKFNDFWYAVTTVVKTLQDNEKKDIARKFYQKYGKEYFNEIIENIAQSINEEESFCTEILINYKKNNTDINKFNILNNYIKENWERSEYTNLFITAPNIPTIKKLLENGFRFEEDNYKRHGFNLMQTILKSERVDIVKIILPYLTMKEPLSMSMDEQHKLLDKYANSKSFEEIKITYYKKYYDFLLNKTDNHVEKKEHNRVKI